MASQLTFTSFVWKSLRRRRLRTLLTLCAIGMAIGAFVCLVGFSNAFEQAWLRIYTSSGTDIAIIQQTFLSTSLDESVVAKVRTLPVVAQATPMIYNVMDLTPDVNALVYGWKADSYEFGSLQLLSGRPFRDGHPELMLGDILAETLKKKLGDMLEIEGFSFKVVAVYHGGSALEAGAVIMPLDELQQLSSLQGKVSTIHVRLRPAPAGEAANEYLIRAQAQIEKALPGLRAIPAAERAGNNEFVRLAHASAWCTSSIALLIGILGSPTPWPCRYSNAREKSASCAHWAGGNPDNADQQRNRRRAPCRRMCQPDKFIITRRLGGWNCAQPKLSRFAPVRVWDTVCCLTGRRRAQPHMDRRYFTLQAAQLLQLSQEAWITAPASSAEPP